MSVELDHMPAFWMRRSRRARTALREVRKRMEEAAAQQDSPSPREAPGGVERRTASSKLFLVFALLCAVLGLGLLGEGLWIKAKAGLAQILLERAFAESIATGKPVKPWGWADTWPVARIAVPRLQVSAIALAGGSGQALAFGPGHLAGTPKPGERGTTVFAAHRDTLFRFLGDLKVGDEIKVTRDDGITFTYEMTGAEIVRWDRSGIDAGAAGYNLALATCWPLDGKLRGPLRYVVQARLKASAMFGDSRQIARAGLY